MVRIIVGTAVNVSDGRIDPDIIEEIYTKKDRSLAGVTAPPMGLMLHKVHY
jgi:tRNA pseudouridine38-40 synthase